MVERSRSRAVWRWGTPLVAVVCGLMFWTSHQSAEPSEFGPKRYVDLASLVRSESREVEALQAAQRDLTAEVDALTAGVDDQQVQDARVRERQIRPVAGLTPVTGTAVAVTLSDSPQEVRETSDLDQNYFVVHQQHVQRVVNALLAGGAEAITIQGQRIVTTTGIRCHGNAIQLDGQAFPQPFVIRGIGDQAAMLSALDTDEYLENYRDLAQSDLVQLGWQVEAESQAVAPAYEGALEASYASPMS